jgi:ATP-binding cassette, subfamily B, multidrug efflux pump
MGSGGSRGGGPFGHLHGPPAEKAHDFRGTAVRLLRMLRPQRLVIGAVVGLAVGSVALAVLGPKLLGDATNLLFEGVLSGQLSSGLTQEEVVTGLRAKGEDRLADMLASMRLVPGTGLDYGVFGRSLLVIAAVYLVSWALAWAQGYLMAGVAQRLIFRLREEADLKLGRLPLSYFDARSRGDVLSRITNDIDNVNTTLQQSLTQLITSALTVIGVLAMMFWISPLLALLSVVTVPLSFVVTVAIARRSQKQFAAQWAWTGTLNGHVDQMYSGHELVKVYGHRKRAIDEFDAANTELAHAAFRAQFISGIIQPSMTFISNLNYVGIAVIGGFRVASGTMSLGDVQAFIQYSRQFTMPITQVASIANVLQSGIASAERVFELLDEPEEPPDPVRPHPPSALPGRIVFDNVSFRYTPDKPLITDLNLRVEPGQTVAIVGPTGAGKTTLVNLLMRFYDVDAGRITIDGVDIRDLRREDLRRYFGMVLQDAWLFSGTIRDNIAYGGQDPSDDQIAAAATAAEVDHVVHTLSDGFDTVLEDEAANVSTGQRQLLTIARAFLADPAILILDEATSSVDTRTEMLIQRAMTTLRTDRTGFVIAHRLSTVRDADLILVMDQGRIVETGNHLDLLARRGFYHDLHHSQFATAPVDGGGRAGEESSGEEQSRDGTDDPDSPARE